MRHTGWCLTPFVKFILAWSKMKPVNISPSAD